MNKTRSALALLLTILLILALPAVAMAAEYPAVTGMPADDLTGKTVILHTNDVHGAIDGYAVVAALRTELQRRGAEVLLVDAGDYTQGGPDVNTSKGADAIALMNAAGYDVAALGNHEFDYNPEVMARNVAAAEFTVVCANVLRDGALLTAPNWMYTAPSGLKIGFFGITTPETQTKAMPTVTKGMDFLTGEALYDCAREQVRALRDGGADLVIALTHLGVSDESAPDRSLDLVAAVPGIDLLIDGHSHTVMTAGEDGAPIQSTGTKFANIGAVVIDNASKSIVDRFLIPTEGLDADPAVDAVAAEVHAKVDNLYGEVIGESLVELEGDRKYNRTQETNHGNLIADAQLWYLRREPGSVAVDDDHLIAVMNGGTIRDWIHVGPVTRKMVYTVLPYGNTLCVVYATGAQLLEALEAATFCTPTQIGGFPHVVGLEWTLDTTKPYDRGAQYPGSTYDAPASIRRVSIRSVNGKPFSLTDTYAIAASDFLAVGGDTYHVFSALEHMDTGVLLDSIVADYIQEALGGVIDERYAAPRGGLKMITVENSVCVPSPQILRCAGATVSVEAYNINGENYCKLRDVAMLLSETPVSFEVRYDPETDAVTLTTGAAYTPVGGELSTGTDRSADLAVSRQSLSADGKELNLCAYNLAGNNFYRLRDLGDALGFTVEYNPDLNAAVISVAA